MLRQLGRRAHNFLVIAIFTLFVSRGTMLSLVSTQEELGGWNRSYTNKTCLRRFTKTLLFHQSAQADLVFVVPRLPVALVLSWHQWRLCALALW
jgi:hypothetical protein